MYQDCRDMFEFESPTGTRHRLCLHDMKDYYEVIEGPYGKRPEGQGWKTDPSGEYTEWDDMGRDFTARIRRYIEQGYRLLPERYQRCPWS